MAKGKTNEHVTFDTVRRLGMDLPGVEEGTSYGTPALKVKGKLFTRLHDNGEWLVVRIDLDERAMRLKSDPDVFLITDHYIAYPWILVRLSVVRENELRELLEDAWRLVAPKGLLADLDGG
jgi:hypothetical protein